MHAFEMAVILSRICCCCLRSCWHKDLATLRIASVCLVSCCLRLASSMLAGDFECNSGPNDQKPYTSDCVSMLNTIHTRIGLGGTGPAEQWEQSGTCRVVITPPSTGPPTSADLWTDVEFIIFKCNSNQTGGSRTLSNGYRVDVNRLPAADYGTPGIPAAPAVNGVPTTTCPTGGQACSNVGSSDGCCPGETCRSTMTGTSSCQA